MKAALFTEKDQDLVIRDDIELGELGPKDVHVKIGSSGVCHSDLSVVNGTIPMPPPAVLGHEGSGIVDSASTSIPSCDSSSFAGLMLPPTPVRKPVPKRPNSP